MTFQDKDLHFLASRGISQAQFQEQIALFQSGVRYADLRSAATIGDGIYKLSLQEEIDLIALYDAQKEDLDILKFTPASGAATRMFKFLFEFLEEFDEAKDTVNAYLNKKNAQDLRLFYVGLDSFPFYEKTRNLLANESGEKHVFDVNYNRWRFVKLLLDKDHLNYGNTPKGLFPFHRYASHNASPFEEHLFEAVHYASVNNKARLHFTISEEHQSKFVTAFEKTQKRISDKTGTQFEISYSYQKAGTDTITVDLENNPVRTEDGNLYLRPGGHGSLIENLNEQKADILFIKNIDNVVVHEYKEVVGRYKKILAGKLVSLQKRAFDYLNDLDKNEVDENFLFEIVAFLQDIFSLKLTPDFEKFSKNYQIQYLRELLDRPIRVCGMVRNEGEPGGGPFWVKQESGRESLQIIESVQIDPASKQQQQIKNEATHFNPVDLVCGIKNYKGEKYDLTKFVDKKASFITQKTLAGKPIKALEHPGLWNGAMANWNTIFVEVPLITFNPVKTVNDLLKPAHQVKR